jgi:hypothetical protein
MQRKLIKQSSTGLTLTVPIKWARRNNLEAGDVIDILDEGDQLIIKGEGESPERIITVEIPPESTFALLKTIIANAYKKGYDVIKVKYSKQEQLSQIELSVSELIGHEILGINNKVVIIRSVAKDLDREYQNLVKKSFYLIKENINKVIVDIKENNFNRESEIKEFRLLVLKYTDYCKRIINRNMKSKDTHYSEYLIVWTLEKISKIVHYLYQYLENKKTKVSEKTLESIEFSFDIFVNLYGYYFKNDLSYLPKFSIIKDKFMYDELFNKLNDREQDAVLIYYAASIIARCQDLPGHFYSKGF